jgi:predicted Zn-dependent protease
MAAPPINQQPGSLDAALANGARLLATNPAAAAMQARLLLKNDARNTAALRLLARALAAQGQAEQAGQARAQAIQLSRHVRPIAAAHEATQAGRPDRAESLLRPYLDRYPDDPVAQLVLGEALARIGDAAAAAAAFTAALAEAPDYAEARLALVRLHQRHFDQVAALDALAPLLTQRPADIDLRRWQASLLSNRDDHVDAAQALQELTELAPGNTQIWISYGDELRTLGRSTEADAAYRKAVRLSPLLGAGWWGLAALHHQPFDDSDRTAMLAALDATTANDPSRIQLHFALGTAYEQAGDRARAFEQFAAGNALRLAAEPFDPATVAAEAATTARVMTAEFFASRAAAGNPAADPIFIVGMPRSGSTLVEQILSGHSQIEGTAELPIIPLLIREMSARHRLPPDRSYRELLPRIEADELHAIGTEYLRRAAPHRKTGKPYFLDKLPHNWADAGFISLILPNAKIVDVRRAPLDCCWSNFRMLFARGHPSSNSLTGMAEFYRHYVGMMAHFDAALPGRIHRVIYERLVDDIEGEVRGLTEYLGVAFEPAMLEFHRADRPVATASAEQVRRPLNRQGIGAWQAYEPWLGPLKAAVGDLQDTYAG